MEKCQKGNSLAAYSTSRAVLRGLGGSNPARLPGIGETCLMVTRPDPTHFHPPRQPESVCSWRHTAPQ